MSDAGKWQPTRREVLVYGAGALAALSVAPVIAACAPGSSTTTTKRGGTLKHGLQSAKTTDSFDPARSITDIEIFGNGLLYDRLLAMDSGWNLSPSLASDFSPSSDVATWSFKIRSGVEFHNGKTLTSADVKAHILRLLDKANGNAGYGLLHPIIDAGNISTPDSSTIKFTLNSPDAFFGVKAAHYTAFVPWAGTTDYVNSPVGTGPFKLKSFQPGAGFEMVRNPNYWKSGQPLLDGVTAVNIPDIQTLIEGCLSGDVDLMTLVPSSSYATFASSSTAELLDLKSYSPYLYDIDSSIKPYSDPRVSKAMKMLINRQQFLDVLFKGHGLVSADSMVAPVDPFYPPDLKPFPYDPEQAKSLLAAAGYASGFKDNLWSSSAYPYLDDAAAFAKQAWGVANLDMTIQSVSNDAYIAAFLHQPIVMDYALRLHPVTMFEAYMQGSSPSNISRLHDDQIDGWIKELERTVDPSKQKQLSGEIIHRYNDIAAEIVPVHFAQYWGKKKRVQGLQLDPMTNVDLRGAYLG